MEPSGGWAPEAAKKQQHPTRSFQASLSSCSQRGFNISAHACAPKRACTWWVCAWKLQGCARCALKTTDIPWFLFQMLKSREWRATPDTLTPCQAPKIGSRWALISSAEISRRTCGVQYTVVWKGQGSAPDSRLSPTQKWACVWAFLVVAPVNHKLHLIQLIGKVSVLICQYMSHKYMPTKVPQMTVTVTLYSLPKMMRLVLVPAPRFPEFISFFHIQKLNC